MKYTVRAYTISVSKPFKTVDEAVSFIQKDYPELSKETIEKYINPKIDKNESDKPRNISSEIEDSGKTDSKTGKGELKPNRTTAS